MVIYTCKTYNVKQIEYCNTAVRYLKSNIILCITTTNLIKSTEVQTLGADSRLATTTHANM